MNIIWEKIGPNSYEGYENGRRAYLISIDERGHAWLYREPLANPDVGKYWDLESAWKAAEQNA